jgi:hypothetical protein
MAFGWGASIRPVSIFGLLPHAPDYPGFFLLSVNETPVAGTDPHGAWMLLTETA